MKKHSTKSEFGSELNICSFSVRGKIGKGDVVHLSDEIIKAIKMTPMPGALLCSYPFDSKGGNGFTFFQALTESFLAVDAWDDLCGAYIFIASCNPFDKMKVKKLLAAQGLKVTEIKPIKLHLRT